jgi:MFS family permease
MPDRDAVRGGITMRKDLSASGYMTLVLGLVTFLWLLFHVYSISTDLPGVLRFDLSNSTTYVSGVGYLVMLAFHAAALVFLFKQTRLAQEPGGGRILAIAFGVVSLFAISVEKVMYDELGREIALEFPVPDEIVFLYACLAVNALFAAVMTSAAYRALLRAPSSAERPRPQDERLFSLAQVMGMISGLTGVLLTLALIGRGWPAKRFWVFFPFYALFLLPYTLAVLSWSAAKRRKHPADWHDEKQMRDILKASFTTLLLSIPGLAVLALIRRPLHFYWFPYYLFFVLFVFSAGTLYYFKRE